MGELSAPAKGHIPQLDALRGCAAMIVVFGHFARIWIYEAAHPAWTQGIAHHNPLWAFLISANSSVIFFFVLSGFVLCLPWHSGRNQPYPAFAVRRVCRIYLPYVVALLPAIAVTWRFHGSQLYGHDFRLALQHAPDARTIISHLLFLGRFDTYAFNPPIWSLVHEMRISLIFPVLAWLALRRRPLVPIIVAIVVAYVAFYWSNHFNGAVLSDGYLRSGFDVTLGAIAPFLMGATLAVHRHHVGRWYRSMKLPVRIVLACVALGAYLYGPQVGHHLEFLPLIASGGCYAIVVAMNQGIVSRFLTTPALRFLGRVSYSIYLVHMPLLTLLSIAAVGRFPYILVLPLLLAATLLAAAGFYVVVEKPSMSLGRWLTERRTSTA